ncbi:MAG: DoxX family protein [Kofleriaceae bacterium]
MTLSRTIERVANGVEPQVWIALRFVAGVMFAFHGAQKLFGLFGKATVEFGTQMWLGGVIELVGGMLIAIGLFTRAAAFVSSGTMAVAYVQFHWKLDAGDRFWPIVNRGELAALYCFLFLFIAARGPGQYSIDGLIANRQR